MGCHHIPPEVIARRYGRSIQNFRDLFLSLADRSSVFGNSNIHQTKIVAEAENGVMNIHKEVIWNRIKN